MLTKHQEEYVLDFLSGSGPMGVLFLCCKNRFDIAGAKIFPAQAFDCDFRWGLPPDRFPRGGLGDFSAEVSRILKAGCEICLFRECDFKKSDPCMATESSPMAFVKDDIFYLLKSDSDYDVVCDTIYKADKFLLMGSFSVGSWRVLFGDSGFSSGEDSFNLSKDNTFTYAKLEEALAYLMGIAIGIFDEEGVCYIPCLSGRG